VEVKHSIELMLLLNYAGEAETLFFLQTNRSMVKMKTKTLIPSLAFVWVLATTCIVLAKEPIEPMRG
jgi:hypothetical protein